MRILWIASALLPFVGPLALAAEGYENPVAARILPGWERPDGTRIIGVELTLAPGWKTYWRAPGDSGIPPRFDWSGSRNVGPADVTWPTPEVSFDQGMRSIVYQHRVVFPVHITPLDEGAPLDVRLGLDMGVCSDVCMPHRVDLQQHVEAGMKKRVPAIAAALASQPYSRQEAGVRRAECALAAIEGGMRIETRVTMPPAGDREEVVIEAGHPDIWVSDPESRREGGTLVSVAEFVPMSGGAVAIDRSQVRITVLGGTYAVDIQGCERG